MNKILLFFTFAACICLPGVSFGQITEPSATIRAVVSGGKWSYPGTWDSNRVPNADDVVAVSVPVYLNSDRITISGLVIENGGRVYGRSPTYPSYMTVTNYFKNNGSVGSHIRSMTLGGYIENNGPVSQSNKIYISSGDLFSVGDLNMQVRLLGDVALHSDLVTSYGMYPGGHTINSNNFSLRVNHLNNDLVVNGAGSITVDGTSGEEVLLHAITAPESDISIQSDKARMFGSVTANNISIDAKTYISKTHLRFTGSTTVTANGQLYGNVFNVRHIVYFEDTVTNYGTLGPYVYPHMQSDFINLGQYTGNEVRLQGDGDRNIVGTIPRRVILDANQRWLTSPTIGSLKSNGHVLHIPANATVRTSGIFDSADIEGEGALVIVDPAGAETVSPNVQNVFAPRATVVLAASDSRVASRIEAQSIEINNATVIADYATLKAQEIKFDGGSLVASGNTSFKREVTLDTPRLSGTGAFGAHTKVRINTNVPKGFTAGYNTEINLFQNSAGWGGTYRLSGLLTNFMSGIDSVFERSGAPNLADQLNTGLPHYFSYISPLGWTKPLSVNASTDPFDSSSLISKRNFFVFNFIPNQQADTKINVYITTPTDPNFSGTVGLSGMRGAVYPNTVTFSDGLWQGQIELFDTGSGQQLVASGVGSYLGHSGRSNHFANLDETIPTGFVRGFVREGRAVRADMGTIVFNDTTDGSEYTTVVNELGAYLTEIPAGHYVVSTTNALPVTIDVVPNETTDQDIVLNAPCEPSDKIPVLLVPGIQGSDSSSVITEIFPRLTKHVPSWDSGELHIHDPFGAVGFTDLVKALESEGYQNNCNIFTVPYDWSLSIVDSAEQFLGPMIFHAKNIASSTQVDIVAHSMGGLVSRAYIQGNNYQDDVRKLAMAGTPNAGSVQAYFSWEGGDPIQADAYGGNLLNRFIAQATLSDQFQTKTLAKNYMVKLGSNDDPCLGLGPPFDYISCDNSKIRNFLRNHAPAVGELFPTYDFLKISFGDSESFMHPTYENKILRALNADSCLQVPCGYIFANLDERDVDTKLFIGAEENAGGLAQLTPEYVYVDNNSIIGNTYNDGEIEFVSMGVGDGTVLVDSVQRLKNDSKLFDEKHAGIIGESIVEIINFIK